MKTIIQITKGYSIIPERPYPLRHTPCKEEPDKEGGAIEDAPEVADYKECMYCHKEVDPKAWFVFKLWKWHNNK